MKVTPETRPNGPALVLEGDVDHESIGHMIDALQRIVHLKSPHIVLDLAKVTYVDSAGIGAIYNLVERVNGATEIDITGVSLNLWRIFEVAGLTARQGIRIIPLEGDQSRGSPPVQPGLKSRRHMLPCARSFSGRFDQLAHIRAFIGDVAGDVRLDKERTFDLQVAVSEASANAIEHGLPPGDVEVSASGRDGRLTITVAHPGVFRPRLRDDPSRAHRGMGLPLMLALTDEVTVSQPPTGGTRVSLSLYLSKAPSA